MERTIDFHLGGRLRGRRRLIGLTQQQLALAIGVRFQQIQKYECGANRVSAARLWRLAAALGVSVSYFYEGLRSSADANQTGRVALLQPAGAESATDTRPANARSPATRRSVLSTARR